MRYIKEFITFFSHLMRNRKLIFTLIVNDFKKQYLGSYLGLFWSFAQPLVYMVVIWFVFSYGFRSAGGVEGVPFVLWLMSGMIPWFFFSSAITSATNAIVVNSFLVKKVAFRVSILPIVPIGSSLIIHIFLVVILYIAFIVYGIRPSVYWLQILYYIFAAIFFILGLCWITSSLRVFIKDVNNFIAIVMQIEFWATPIFWQIDKLSPEHRFWRKLNPAEYIVTGFRDSLINHIWFWEKPYETLYFWSLSLVLIILGAIVFRRLRPHFGDVL